MNLQEKQNIADNIHNQSVESSDADEKASRNLKKLKERLSKLEEETYDLTIEKPSSLPAISGASQSPLKLPSIHGSLKINKPVEIEMGGRNTQNNMPEDIELEDLENL